MTQEECLQLQGWPCKKFDEFNIYTHAELEVNIITKGNIQLALIGFILNPYKPKKSNAEVITDFLDQISEVNDIAEQLYFLTGRFVLIMKISGEILIFNDPCGMRSVFYSYHNSRFYCGSSSAILEQSIPLEKGKKHETFINSPYKANKTEYWLPTDCSPYENIRQLVPNHYLHVTNRKQQRYWPKHPVKEISLEEGSAKAADLLVKISEAGSHRLDLSLPLTAGWDSRVLLSSSKEFFDKLYFYTLQYRTLNETSPDIHIPRKMLDALGVTHHLIDCNKRVAPAFSQIYFNNVSFAHEDWCKIAYGMSLAYPQNKICIKGNCAEISRNFYDPKGLQPPINQVEQILELISGWQELDFIKSNLNDWFLNAMQAVKDTNIYILDLFYWEHKMGSWQAQSQLEWDIVQEAFSPFNHRELIEIMLGVAPKYRKKGDNNKLLTKVVRKNWPMLLKYPINPPKKKGIRYYTKRALQKLMLKS
ncbi:hypothetical protein [Catalinimonas alkaloidigena]|uniref:hypothetical protein n=1 Tax=Catalinimonas alkaloidigena TaxID=1075417 RepID=UPI0024053457|nr:hypothetical protein [Catalinimonas alkaloidigena]